MAVAKSAFGPDTAWDRERCLNLSMIVSLKPGRSRHVLEVP
jgi:hypothetical protein